MLRCVQATPGIVSLKPSSEVGSDAGVEARRIVRALEDVHDSLRCVHSLASYRGHPSRTLLRLSLLAVLKVNMEGGLPPEARSGSGERRVVDQTGIEPVTS
jgi:hypothetical protein